MEKCKREKHIKFFLVLALCVNIIVWFSVRGTQSHWSNVPPAPDITMASAYGLGDRNLAYRVNGIQLQNLGDTGGRVSPLEDYNYDELGKWFRLQHSLDPVSDFTPYLAAYYFGALDRKKFKLASVVAYLSDVGQNHAGNKWRWLAQAIYLARFKMNDYDLAYEYAELLNGMGVENAPGWVAQMPAFIKGQSGDKEAAYALMLQILKSSGHTMHPKEIYSMRIYMCTRLMNEDQASENPLCDGL